MWHEKLVEEMEQLENEVAHWYDKDTYDGAEEVGWLCFVV